MDVLRGLARRHKRVDTFDAKLTVAKMTEEGITGVDVSEDSDGGQHKVEESEVGIHVADLSCNNLMPGSRGGASYPETVEV